MYVLYVILFHTARPLLCSDARWISHSTGNSPPDFKKASLECDKQYMFLLLFPFFPRRLRTVRQQNEPARPFQQCGAWLGTRGCSRTAHDKLSAVYVGGMGLHFAGHSADIGAPFQSRRHVPLLTSGGQLSDGSLQVRHCHCDSDFQGPAIKRKEREREREREKKMWVCYKVFGVGVYVLVMNACVMWC